MTTDRAPDTRHPQRPGVTLFTVACPPAAPRTWESFVLELQVDFICRSECLGKATRLFCAYVFGIADADADADVRAMADAYAQEFELAAGSPGVNPLGIFPPQAVCPQVVDQFRVLLRLSCTMSPLLSELALITRRMRALREQFEFYLVDCTVVTLRCATERSPALDLASHPEIA
jgi:hypothetical protein